MKKHSTNIMKNKVKILYIVFISCFLNVSCSNSPQDNAATEQPDPEPPIKTTNLTISVPCEGNSWVVNNAAATNTIVGEDGIKNWTNSNNKIRTYFYAKSAGDIELGIKAKFTGATKLKITLGNSSKQVDFKATNTAVKHAIGSFKINETGYHYVELEGVSKEGSSFGEVSDILLGDSAWSSKIDYVKPDWFYWGRRGPSVHLSYGVPENKNITWFYNELTVPEGKDPIGSYFMANGFSSGYFGMQVNSETERRILFSVWSAFDTQDPNQIPKEYTVKPLGYGDGVRVGEFGGEGSGAQSYFVYNWKPGTTYKYLLKGESNKDNSIDYTAYFYAPEIGDWKLIASFRRPFPKGKHLTRLHSFLENFVTSTGDTNRKVDYTNQWVYDTEGNWNEMTSAKFTIDNTGASGVRFDYDGGSEGDSFFLRNCGFFSDNETPQTTFTRTPKEVSPNIDFSKLEVPQMTVEVSRNFLDRSTWTIIESSSQEDKGGEGTTGRASDILDGDVNTYWHSCWSGCTATAPHHIIVDMGASKTITGFRFIQRQSLSRTVKDVKLQISEDNSTWESLGDFKLNKTTNAQEKDLNVAKTFRYFKFIAKSSHDGTDNAAMAEIKPYDLN